MSVVGAVVNEPFGLVVAIANEVGAALQRPTDAALGVRSAEVPAAGAGVPLDRRVHGNVAEAGLPNGVRRRAQRKTSRTDWVSALRFVSVGVESRFEITTELPLLLTVEEAAAVLRIGRTLAYSLARRYEESGGAQGLPVIRLGNCLRVPRWALLELACTGRVVALSDLAAHTVDVLSHLDDEPSVVPSESMRQPIAVEQLAMPKSKRPKRSPAAAGRVGQQLVLLPSD